MCLVIMESLVKGDPNYNAQCIVYKVLRVWPLPEDQIKIDNSFNWGVLQKKEKKLSIPLLAGG